MRFSNPLPSKISLCHNNFFFLLLLLLLLWWLVGTLYIECEWDFGQYLDVKRYDVPHSDWPGRLTRSQCFSKLRRQILAASSTGTNLTTAFTGDTFAFFFFFFFFKFLNFFFFFFFLKIFYFFFFFFLMMTIVNLGHKIQSL